MKQSQLLETPNKDENTDLKEHPFWHQRLRKCFLFCSGHSDRRTVETISLFDVLFLLGTFTDGSPYLENQFGNLYIALIACEGGWEQFMCSREGLFQS